MSSPVNRGWLDDARRALANVDAEQPCRTPMVTCGVCTAPVDGRFVNCYKCNEHRNGQYGHLLADLVAPLAYAWDGQSQLGKDVYAYKRDQGERAVNAIGRLAALAYTFGNLHAPCPGRRLGRPVTAKAVMPSLRGNTGTTLTQIADRFLPWPRIRVTATGNYGDAGWDLDPNHFAVDPVPAGSHVLVLDDTWVRGGHAQALTVALKHAGAATVTVVPICRLLSPGWRDNITYSRSPHRRLWDPQICPVTGGTCP